jgi:phosphatidate cytidylyltransferase
MLDDVDPSVAWTLAALGIVLMLAEAAVWSLRRRRPERDWTELGRRIGSWWIIVGAGVIALLAGRTVTLVVLALVSYVALKEYLSMVPTRRADRSILLIAYLAIPTQWWWIGEERYGFFIIWVPVYLFVVLPSAMVLQGDTKGFLRAVGTLHWGLMQCVFAIGHIAYLYVLPDEAQPGPGGAGLVLTLLILTQGNDVAQYCWGRMLGRRRIAPSVSPNKTVEGFLGGLLTTIVVAALLAPLLTPMPWTMALWVGALLAVMGFLGDLSVSAVKRDIGLKDTGNLIPGHGGILDRIDSLMFTAPLMFHIMRYFYY